MALPLSAIPERAVRSVNGPAQPRSFVYSGALNQSWLRDCPGFNALERSTATEKLGKVRLYDALLASSQRTHDVSETTFLFVPLWEYTSWARGRCRGTTHAK